MAICIAGMHRSGTSMVARLLHACGMFLGPAEEFMQPSPDNQGGYWENMRFVMLNERILTQFGGWWGGLPSFPAHWQFAPEVDSLVGEAEALVAEFRDQKCWGWKDPRNSITIPFWRRVIPDLKVVICVRNPFEVVHSVVARDNLPSVPLRQLWVTYYHKLLSEIPPTDRIVTHYESYFQDARAEAQRVSNWLNLQTSDEALDRAGNHVSVGLRHHHVPTAALLSEDVPDEVLRLYLGLCAEAGPLYQQVRERERAAELEYAFACPSARETNPHRLHLGQIERLHFLESELAKHPAGIVSLKATPQAHKSELLIRKLTALRAVKVRLWSRWARTKSE